ncbi:hypothetical protein [Streptomyces sp. TLI_171]|uniref:hypothetical protein n=1 Tax=Streptomyces sp. TLI_171 TaxID=1938859 RepID=UPI000C1864CF|nr:hypothetical protein [Streptomyces sp. TLI_171]RKE19625.1 hypothetical protein BX266_2952 [Streptomyces sp. TLI_171]
MPLFKKGDTVRIARDKYAENGSRDFTGQVGQVCTTGPEGTTVAGLDAGSDQSYWFENSEIERA